MNELALKGAQIVFEDTHVSGHACREELRLIYALTKPKYAIPVHGEYRHLMRHRELAIEMGIPKENAFVLAEGDVLELNKRQGKIAGKVQAGGILVDGLGVGDVGNIVLNDRKLLSQNGLIIATVTLQETWQYDPGRSRYRISWVCICQRIRIFDGRCKRCCKRCGRGMLRT